ncbi:MAG: alpha/beta fold hydrolase, partial [Chloroflexi bacterium]|nr:alpha/beta fold hydrolase [Chloroflexota bacterium]
MGRGKPFDGATMVGTLRRPPLALLLPGLDSVKEEFYSWENVFLKRGLATFSLDGPGQGESLRLRDLHARHDYEVPGKAAYEYVAARPEVDPQKVVIMGYSFGGYYAA